MASTTIPKEKLTDCQRWDMPQFSGASNGKPLGSQQRVQDEATKKVSEVLNGVRQEAYQLGYQQGLKKGYQDGLQQAEQTLADEKARLLAIASGFSQALQEKDLGIANEIVVLALELAKAMLKTKLHISPEALIPVVLDAMHYLPQVQAPARLVLHHEDAKLLRQYLADELAEQHWLVIEDSSIERGGCMVETGENHIDATNQMRWKRLTETLLVNDSWHMPEHTQ